MQPLAPPDGRIILGRWEWVLLPGHRAETHRARIDTGARRSSIHATITDATDEQVTLLLPGGSRATCPLLGQTTVRSSNGTSEERLVVSLPTTIAGVTINTHYTLADRSDMRYPVLLGRDLLAGRFLVDPQKPRQHPKPRQPPREERRP